MAILLSVSPEYLTWPVWALTPALGATPLVFLTITKPGFLIAKHVALAAYALLVVLNTSLRLVTGKLSPLAAPPMPPLSVVMQVRQVLMVARCFYNAKDILLTSYDGLVRDSYCR